MVYQGIPLVNLTGCEIRSVLFGPDGRVEEWKRVEPYIRAVRLSKCALIYYGALGGTKRNEESGLASS
jgi:hypothetical protein